MYLLDSRSESKVLFVLLHMYCSCKERKKFLLRVRVPFWSHLNDWLHCPNKNLQSLWLLLCFFCIEGRVWTKGLSVFICIFNIEYKSAFSLQLSIHTLFSPQAGHRRGLGEDIFVSLFDTLGTLQHPKRTHRAYQPELLFGMW